MPEKEPAPQISEHKEESSAELKQDVSRFLEGVIGESQYARETLCTEWLYALQKNDLDGLDKLAIFMDNHLLYLRGKMPEEWSRVNTLRQRLQAHIDKLLK